MLLKLYRFFMNIKLFIALLLISRFSFAMEVPGVTTLLSKLKINNIDKNVKCKLLKSRLEILKDDLKNFKNRNWQSSVHWSHDAAQLTYIAQAAGFAIEQDLAKQIFELEIKLAECNL